MRWADSGLQLIIIYKPKYAISLSIGWRYLARSILRRCMRFCCVILRRRPTVQPPITRAFANNRATALVWPFPLVALISVVFCFETGCRSLQIPCAGGAFLLCFVWLSCRHSRGILFIHRSPSFLLSFSISAVNRQEHLCWSS